MPRPAAASLALTALLTVLVAAGPISTDLYLPSLPGLGRDLGAGVNEVQLTLSLFLAGFAGAQLVYGPLSDRFGRRLPLLAGFALYTAASVVCALATSIEVLSAARLLQAVGACAGPVLGRAVVRDVYGREGAARALAYMSATVALAPAVAPIVGGALETWFGWRACFVALTVYGATGLVLALVLLPETNQAPDRRATDPTRILLNYSALIRHRAYAGYVLCAAFGYSMIFAFISGSSFVLIESVGLSPAAFGFSFGGVVLGYIAGASLAGRLTQRLGVEAMVGLGGLVASAGGLLLAGLAWGGAIGHGLAGALAVVLPMALAIAGMGLALPSAIAGALAPFPRLAGSASALLGFVQMALAALVGIAVGQLHDLTARPMASAIALSALAIPLAFALLVRRRRGKLE